MDCVNIKLYLKYNCFDIFRLSRRIALIPFRLWTGTSGDWSTSWQSVTDVKHKAMITNPTKTWWLQLTSMWTLLQHVQTIPTCIYQSDIFISYSSLYPLQSETLFLCWKQCKVFYQMILHTICGRVMKDESPNVCSCSFNLCSLLNLPQFSGSLLAVFSYNAIILIFDLHLFFREKCWLPNVTLTSYVQRETNPKAPVPIPHRYNESELRYRPHVLR